MRIKIEDHSLVLSSNNSKMGRVHSFSTMPILTCRSDAPCKKECYAVKLCRIFKNTKKSYQDNTDTLMFCEPEKIIEKLIQYITLYNVKLFRWNVSGDFNIDKYFDITLEVAKQCPGCNFLAFTKMYDLSKVKLPQNYKLVFSCWGNMKPENEREVPCAYFDNGIYEIPEYAKRCSGGCDKCMKCWKLKAGQAVKFKKH